jgi:hypothetical protein
VEWTEETIELGEWKPKKPGESRGTLRTLWSEEEGAYRAHPVLEDGTLGPPELLDFRTLGRTHELVRPERSLNRRAHGGVENLPQQGRRGR